MVRCSGVPRNGVTLLPAIGRVAWGVGPFVKRKGWCHGRSQNGSGGCAATKGRRDSSLQSPRRWAWENRGRWKWNCPPACACGCEVKPMWFTPEVRRILAYSKPVDLRKSIDGLVGLVKSVLEEDHLSGSLFVFVNRRGNYVKLVSWDRTGWCLFAKRLEHGHFHFPTAEAKQELSWQVFHLLLDGIALGGRY